MSPCEAFGVSSSHPQLLVGIWKQSSLLPWHLHQAWQVPLRRSKQGLFWQWRVAICLISMQVRLVYHRLTLGGICAEVTQCTRSYDCHDLRGRVHGDSVEEVKVNDSTRRWRGRRGSKQTNTKLQSTQDNTNASEHNEMIVRGHDCLLNVVLGYLSDPGR